MSKQEQAAKLLEFDKVVFLITTDKNGRPDARAMSSVKVDGLKTIWLITGKSSDKYRELSHNADCMLYATALADTQDYMELRLWGHIEFLDDADTKALIWRDEYAVYFPEGKDDPNMCVLKFKTYSGALQTPDGKENLVMRHDFDKTSQYEIVEQKEV